MRVFRAAFASPERSQSPFRFMANKELGTLSTSNGVGAGRSWRGPKGSALPGLAQAETEITGSRDPRRLDGRRRFRKLRGFDQDQAWDMEADPQASFMLGGAPVSLGGRAGASRVRPHPLILWVLMIGVDRSSTEPDDWK